MWKDMIPNNLSALNVAIFRYKTVQSMEMTSLSLNASIAVQLLSGSVGGTLIFVNPVIKSNVMEIMFQNIRKSNFQSVLDLENVRSEVIMD